MAIDSRIHLRTRNCLTSYKCLRIKNYPGNYKNKRWKQKSCQELQNKLLEPKIMTQNRLKSSRKTNVDDQNSSIELQDKF